MKVGESVVVLAGDREVLGTVSRVTPRGVEVTFELKLAPAALGDGLGLVTWRTGGETLFPLADAAVTATVTVLVSPESPGPEQRAYVRLERRLAVDVEVELPDGRLDLATGSTRDLSTEGAKLRLNRGLKRGETVALCVHLDEGAIKTAAEVLRHRKLDDGSHEVAVRFSLVHGDDRTRLVRYVFARMSRTSPGGTGRK